MLFPGNTLGPSRTLGYWPASRNSESHIVMLQEVMSNVQMDVSENRGTPKSSILIGFSIINHPFWGTLIFGNEGLK